MNKHFVTIAACALAIFGASSCKGTLQEKEVSLDTHSVVFNANLEDNTKTALLIKVVPSWKNTENASVHLYENDKAGDNCTITTGEGGNYEKAKFSATFSGSTAPFCYRGVVASVNDDDKFYIPAIQTPDAESLIDPNADFLIGTSNGTYETAPENIDLFFSRPVALSRLAITNFEGEKVMSVKITSEDELTGEVAYDGINFEDRTASFTGGSTELTLSYGEEGVAYSGGTFYAYFVSIPGTMKITNVEVTTDEYIYTKTVGKSTTFTSNDFKNIALNLSDAVKKSVSTKSFYKVTSVEVGKEYVIVSNGHALKNNNGAVAAEEVTDVAGVIELDDYDALVWTAGTPTYTGSDYPGYTYTNGGKKLNRDDGNIQLTSASNDKYYNFAYAEDGTSGNYTFRCGTHYYTGYDSGWKAPTSKVYVTLYCSEKPKTSRNLAFAQTSVQKIIGDPAFTITLNGNTTGGVTYSSSVPTVATVNATTGEVEIAGEGTTTIKAECAETAEYKAGEASFTLKVVDPSKVTTYTKVTTAPSDWSGTYLFVKESANVAFAYNQTDYKVSVAISEGKILSNDLKAYELTVSKSNLGGDKYEIKTTSGKYVYKYGSTDILFDSNISGSNQYYALFSGNGDVTINCQRSGGSNNYFQYSSNKFGFGTSSSETIQLYKLEGGSTPTPPTTVTYTKLTSNSSIPNGTYIIVNNTDGYALKNATNPGTDNAQSVSPTSGVISGEQSGLEFTITAVDGGYTIKSGNQYMFASASVSDTFIGYQASENKFELEKKGTDLFCLKTKKGSEDGQYLYKKSSNAYFKLGGSGKPSETDGGVYLYKKSEE